MEAIKSGFFSVLILLLKFIFLFTLIQSVYYLMGNSNPEIIGLFILSVAVITFVAVLFAARLRDKKSKKGSLIL